MAKCDFCGKGVTFGIKVSHSHRRSNRAWKPNVKRVKAVVNGDSLPCVRLYQMPPLQQGRARRLIILAYKSAAENFSGVFILSSIM